VDNLASMLQRTYRVEFETDLTTKQVTAKLPTLNHTADFGDTAEKALSNLRELAFGLIEVLLDEGKEVPRSDTTEKGGVFLSLSLNLKTRPKAKRVKNNNGCAIAATQRQRGSPKTQKSRF
jgi:predicted RNase H-like HicB family nuclease